MHEARLVGRATELAVLNDFVRGSTSGGGALLLVGEPGVGKSALLDATVVASAAHGARVIRGGGVEYEADVGFAGLHQLVGQLGDHVEELRPSRRSALEVALGLAPGPAPDRLAVLDAALATFRRAAATAPLLVVVDDMHWLDEATASAIGFVGRRLADSRVALLGAARTGAGGFAGGTGWRELAVPALGREASLDLLADRFAHLPARVLRDVVEEAQGNPLALLEFGAAEGSRLTPGSQCAAAVATGAGRAVRRLYDERVARLPADTRRLLLLSALEGSGNLAVLASAGGSGLQALGAAERDDLVIVDERIGEVVFRHPMIKSVVVEESTHHERRAAHARLAEVLVGHVERRGLHLAEAAVEASEEVAAAVEAGADATLRRGDVVGGVSRLLRAADLSPDPSERGRRLARAAFVRAFSEGRLESASLMLREARLDDPRLGGSLPAAAASAYLLLNTEGDVETSHRLLVQAVGDALDDPGHDEEVLSLALYTLVAVCHFAGRPEPWHALDDLLGRLQPSSAPDAVLLAQAHGDPARATPWALREIDRAVSGLGDTLDAGL
ncbi:MAG TPA: AAA family ATPase, partial [Nocardioides sp.]|nr:AAA family ATPase [Nocardioides sp.]